MLLVAGCSRGIHSLDNNHTLKDNIEREMQKTSEGMERAQEQCSTTEAEMSDGDPEPSVSSS